MQDQVSLVQVLSAFTGLVMHRSMQTVESFTRQWGISMPQFTTLMRLYHRNQACMVSDIADQMDITNAAASQMAQRLVESGLLTRVEAAHDRRIKQLSLTLAGRQLVETAMDLQRQWMQSITEELTSEEKIQVAEGLKALVRVARQREYSVFSNQASPEKSPLSQEA